MKLLWFFLLLCVFLVGGGSLYNLVENDSGYVLIVWGNYSIEMSIWFALIAVVAATVLIYLTVRLLLGSARGVSNATKSVLGYNARVAEQRTIQGLLYFIEGNWSLAKRHLVKSAKKTQTPIINYLAAARSAYELGDEQEALQLLHKAENSADNSELAVALTQARMQLANQQHEQAVATLERASDIARDHPMVLELLQQAYVTLSDWPSLKALMPRLRRYRVGTDDQRQQLEMKLYREWLADVIEQSSRLADDEKLPSIRQCWQQVPDEHRSDELLVSSYVAQLMAFGDYDEAERLLNKSLRKQWFDRWVDLYGLLNCNDSKKPLLFAEGWLKARPNNGSLLLALGRLCLRNQQWGRAREYFENSLAQQPRPETYAELARLLAHLGEHKASTDLYQQGLLLTAHTLPKLPQPVERVAG